MPTAQFETDSDGNIISNPVTGWTMATFAGMGIVLAVQYADTPQSLQAGKSKSIQFALTPHICLELAEKLTKLAKRILDEPPSNTPPS